MEMKPKGYKKMEAAEKRMKQERMRKMIAAEVAKQLRGRAAAKPKMKAKPRGKK